MEYNYQNTTIRVGTEDFLATHDPSPVENAAIPQALQVSLERFRALAESLADLLWVTTPNGIIKEENPLLRSGNYWEEKAWLEIFHPDDQEIIYPIWKEALANGRPYEIEGRILRGNTYCLCLVRGAPVRGVDGHIREWINLGFDITKSKYREQVSIDRSSRLEVVFESIPDALFFYNAAGEFVYINTAGRALLAQHIHSDAHLTLDLLRELLQSYGGQRQALSLIRILRGEVLTSTNPVELRTRTLEGRDVYLSITGGPVRAPNGQIVGGVVVARDETERHRLEELLRDSDRQVRERASQLEVIFEAITDGVFVADTQGKIIQVNEGASTLLSIGRPWVNMSSRQRQEIFQFYNEAGQIISPEQWPMQRILRGEVLVGLNAFETVIRGPEGQRKDLIITGAPIRNLQGQIVGAVVVFHDITERSQLQRRIQKALDALLSLAELLVRIPAQLAEQPAEEIPNIASIISTVGQYLVALIRQVLDGECACVALLEPETNELRLIAIEAFSPEDVLSWRDVIQTSLLADHFRGESLERLSTNEVVICDLGFTPTLPYEGDDPETLLVAPMLIGDHLIGVVGLSMHVSPGKHTYEEVVLLKAAAKLAGLMIERERLQYEWTRAYANECALREANRRFDEFLSLASHELRSPLTTIMGNIQLAQRRLRAVKRQSQESAEPLESKLERIQQPLEFAVHRANVQKRMISDLLDVSRIQANRLELRLESSDLAMIVSEIVEDQRQIHPERTIMLEMPEKPVLAIVDRDRIGQVIHNYLTNALKYSSEDRPVFVDVRVEGPIVRVSVRDEGPGIPPDVHDLIWDRFYRVEGIEVQSGEEMSLGLGLHICRIIVERHQGQVGLQSECGCGSTFWFTLPLDQNA